ncbi:hypothetical protein [Ewingella americana]|uniref:Uncharacterized protein n=1 Tax=Ewingella americana TaxID=41202 RepID=A0A502GIX7_9GAMM|nr:hypothetical protein [Ewingella americana]TPG61518.1 hypothetical protein EAH77_12820 [Ewingella americana]
METQTPKWIAEARKMISGCDSRVKHYWNNVDEEDRRYLCFLAGLKQRHIECAWDELTEAEKVSLWGAVLKVRRLQKSTNYFTPEDFKGAGACRVARREVEQDTNNSMH